MQFLDVRTDYAFKKVFGSEQSKDILMCFLNAVLDFDGEKIDDLTIVDPYQVPEIKGMKDTFVDVKAQLSNNTQVIIEMQVLNVEGFEKRILYNAAKTYSAQLQKGHRFQELNPVIALTITNFKMFEEFETVTSYFKLLEKNHLTHYKNDIELVFIELPKFNKTDQELNNICDKWIYFIKNAGKLDFIPLNLEIEKPIKKAFDIANTTGLSYEELEAQYKRFDFINMQISALEYAEKKVRKALEQGLQQGLEKGIEQGLEKGIEQGIEQGARKKAIEMANIMLQKNYAFAEIAELTNLTVELIEQISKEHD